MTNGQTTTAQTADPKRLAVDWVSTLLEESEVTAEDNFLDLGGHSALAFELSDRAKQTFGVEIDMQILFERSIGEALADVVNRAETAK